MRGSPFEWIGGNRDVKGRPGGEEESNEGRWEMRRGKRSLGAGGEREIKVRDPDQPGGKRKRGEKG
jgi:hypothetical protein